MKLTKKEVLWIIQELLKYYFYDEAIRKIIRMLSARLGEANGRRRTR